MRTAVRLSLLGLLLGTAGLAHAVQDCELNSQSVNPANGNTTAGKTGLMRCKDRDSGELQREQELKNGVFMGLVRFYDKGQLIKEHSVNERGNMDGRAREFHAPSGTVIREATYSNGREVGLVRLFHTSGALSYAAFHEDPGGERASAEFNERGQLQALRCGPRPMLAPAVDDARLCGFANNGAPSNIELFDSKARLRARATWVAGKRLRNENLYENGQPSALEEIAGTQRTERRFAADGIQRRETVSLLLERGSVKQRELEYSERGTLVREQRWSTAGEPLADDSYYLNGQPHSKTVYTGDSPATRWTDITEFHDNGQRAAQGRYTSGGRYRQTPVGTHQRFSAGGTLIAETSYDDKGRATRERAWDDNGQLQRDDEVFEDGSRKAFTR